MLEVGVKAPDFKLPDQNGDIHTLDDFKGKKMLLYFYPKDNTPGCSKQAQMYSSLKGEFDAKGIVIVGVSKDSVKSHKNFEEKQNLSITLLSDTERETIQAYDVWKEKKNYGKVLMGVVRTNPSYISWLSYDSLNIELPDGHLFFAPIINWGKYRKENGRLVMPVSVRLNHAIAAGYLVANVFRLLEIEIKIFCC